MRYITDVYGKEHAITEARYKLIKKVLNFLRHSEKSSITTQNFINEFQVKFKKVNVNMFDRSDYFLCQFETEKETIDGNDITWLYMTYSCGYDGAQEEGYIVILIVEDKNGYVQFGIIDNIITDMKFKAEIDTFLVRVHENKNSSQISPSETNSNDELYDEIINVSTDKCIFILIICLLLMAFLFIGFKTSL